MSEAAKIIKRTLRPGDSLVKGNGRPTSLFVIQGGRVIISPSKDKIMDLHHGVSPQCIAEEPLFGIPSTNLNVVVVEQTQVIEIPHDLAQTQMKKNSPKMNLILKGLFERVKGSLNDLKALKMPREPMPCPPDLTAKVFGVIFHTAKFVGKSSDGLIYAKWPDFKSYAIDVFEETEYRIRQAILILEKLGYAKADLDSTGNMEFKDMTQIERFFDFYQNYHFKSGYASLLKTNSKITAITETLLRVADPYKPDRAGVVRMPFKQTIDEMKAILGPTFEADHLFRLEQKGLMVKRVATQDGGVLSFWRSEFEQMLLNWKVLREVEKWNEKGFVGIDEVQINTNQTTTDAAAASPSDAGPSAAEQLAAWTPLILSGKAPTIRYEPPAPDELLCPTCMATITEQQKSCTVCDTQLIED